MFPRIFRKSAFVLFLLTSVAVSSTAQSVPGARHLVRPGAASQSSSATPDQNPTVLPPLPAGVTELNFSSFFKTPVGPRGLEIADELAALNGKRVRILGYMVKEQAADHDEPPTSEDASAPSIQDRVPDRFLLTALPQATNFSHYGLCEDLPPQTVYVTLTKTTGAPVVHTARPLLLIGLLTVGPQTEPDGRVSIVRLKLDPATPAVR